MRIPLVGVPAAPNAQQTFAPVSTTTYDKVGAAGARLGEAVEGVATDLPVRIKTAIDAGTLAKAETAAEAHFQGFTDSLQDGKNPENNDPSTFLSRWQDSQNGFKDALAEDNGVKGLSYAARIQYQTDMAKWQAMTTQQVGHLATQKAVNNAIGDTTVNYEQKLLLNDQDGAKAVVQRAMNTGVFSPEAGKQMIFQIPMKAEYNQAVSMMSRDPNTGGGPIILEKALQAQNDDGSFKFYPHVVGQQREALMFDANRNARVVQQQTSEGYVSMRAMGQQPDPDQVNKDLRLGKLTQSEAVSLLKQPKVFSPEAYSGMVTQISQFDPSADPTHEKEAAIYQNLNVATANLSPPAAARLNELLKEKLDPKSPLNTEEVKTVLKANEELFNHGGYGAFEGTRHPTKEEMAMDTSLDANSKIKTLLPEVMQQAAIKRATVDQKVMDYVQAHPGSEHDEAAVMKAYVQASQATRGSLGIHLFNPPTLTPSAPAGQ